MINKKVTYEYKCIGCGEIIQEEVEVDLMWKSPCSMENIVQTTGMCTKCALKTIERIMSK